MVLSDGPSILHLSPLRPRLDRVPGRIPDLLTPDDVFEVKFVAMIHDPLGDGTTSFGFDLYIHHSTCQPHLPICVSSVHSLYEKKRRSVNKVRTYTSGTRAHEIIRHSAAVFTIARAGAVPIATDLADLVGESSDDFLGAVDGSLLACSYVGDRWWREACIVWLSAVGEAALEAVRTRAEVRQGVVAAALRGEATVTSVAAGRLGAASDVVRCPGAGIHDGGASRGGAAGGRDADTWCSAGAGARAVY